MTDDRPVGLYVYKILIAARRPLRFSALRSIKGSIYGLGFDPQWNVEAVTLTKEDGSVVFDEVRKEVCERCQNFFLPSELEPVGKDDGTLGALMRFCRQCRIILEAGTK